jgi:hypothetical protein
VPSIVMRESARGRYVVAPLGDDVVWFRFDGYVAGAWWAPTEAVLDAVIRAHGHVLMLGDGWSWTNYESSYRTGCTRWFMARRATIRGVHLLVQSAILRMGVQVVNLVVPVISGYGDVAAFTGKAAELVPDLAARLREAGVPAPG